MRIIRGRNEGFPGSPRGAGRDGRSVTIIQRALVLALSAVALSLAAGPAGAAEIIATALSPDPVSSGIAMNARGQNVAAFEAPVGDGFAVFARSRARAGGPWGPRTRISGVTERRPDQILVAVDERGRAMVIWRRVLAASRADLQSALRATATGAWRNAGEISSRPVSGEAFSSPVLAFAGGRATFAWGEISSAGWQVRRATYDLDTPTARHWSFEEPQVLGVQPALAVDSRGDVVAIGPAAARGSGDPSAPVVVTSRAAGSADWEAPVTLDPAGSQTTIAIADGGQTVAAWRRGAPAAGIAIAARAGLAEAWAPAETLAAAGFLPVAAVGPTGQALVAYSVNLDTLDPPDPDLVFPPSGLTYPLGNIMRARRRAPTGVWGAEETVFAFYDGMRETYREARNVRAAVDAFGTTLLAWSSTDSGLGAVWATAAPAAAPFPQARNYITIATAVMEQVALAPSGRGEAALMWVSEGGGAFGSLNLWSDRVPAASCAAPPQSPPPATADTITLSAVQLRINQRIYAAALRRADALDGWLRARIATRDLCGGGIGASSLGAGVEIGPAPAPRTIPVAKPRALAIRPAADKSGVAFTLSVDQLRINQRIASAALRRANALSARLDAGLSGGDIRAGAVSADRIGATIAAIRVSSVAPPAPTRTVIAPAAEKTGVVFSLSAAQLRINQRIGQAAIRRLNAVRGRLLDGISGDELRRATVTGANLTP